MKNINDLIQEDEQAQDGVNGAESQSPAMPHQAVAEKKVTEALAGKMAELKQKEIEDGLKKTAQDLQIGYVNLKGIPVPAEILERIDLAEVKAKKVLCFYYTEHRLARLATTETEAAAVAALKNEYQEKLKVPVEMFLTSESSFGTVVKQYELVPQVKPAPKGVEVTGEDLQKFSGQLTSLESVKGLINSVSTTELVAVIIAAGLKTDASDIHIEAEVDGIKLRYRIDGVLHTAAILDKNSWQQLISRLKLLSGLKINISDKPQDGRFSIFLAADKVDVRVSTLPTAYGESVVMRLLMSKVTSLKFSDLGFSEEAYKILAREIQRPNGMIITTGPTGSGKTTTLYAILNELNKSDTKIITIEDPIEYELKGINQSQVEPARDYTFAKGLRSIVRQDPDIIMVGEMRDLETVDIALNAALTGHLVLSTLHTNDAAGAIPRFLAMGAKPYLLAPALDLIMAQRLVRRLCNKCKKEIELEPALKEKVASVLGALANVKEMKFYGAGGCVECNQLGYKGRIGIFEMFVMNKEIEEVILSGQVSEYKIREIANRHGMITMAQDGLLKALQGVTSVEEVFRVAE